MLEYVVRSSSSSTRAQEVSCGTSLRYRREACRGQDWQFVA